MLKSPKILAAALVLCGLEACNRAPEREPVIGEAYAGPAILNLHKDIDPKSPPAAIAHHGDRLEILAQRRRWYRVRTPSGAEGWTDDRELLDSAQMKRLLALRQQTGALPSQGVATTFGTLNVHTEANRSAPSFLQVREGEKVDVILHRVTGRAPLPKRQILPPRPKPARKSKGKEKKQSKPSPVDLPPPPSPPSPPTDWVALSKERSFSGDEMPSSLPAAALDDWTLIRAASGQTGWVLTSRLYMAIPDGVAQYAEGHRITSYFVIGKTSDHGESHEIWLWTTAETLGEDHDFDGFRVFTWSTRRHRYETAFIQRHQRGFFPVTAADGEFSVCLEKADGLRIRKRFTLTGNSVRASGEARCEIQQRDDDQTPDLPRNLVGGAGQPVQPKDSFIAGTWKKIKSLVGWKDSTGTPAR